MKFRQNIVNFITFSAVHLLGVNVKVFLIFEREELPYQKSLSNKNAKLSEKWMMGGSQQSAAFVLTVSVEMTGRHTALDPPTFSAYKKNGKLCGFIKRTNENRRQGAKYYLAAITK